jgi:Protein of unknown function (DUF2924)/Enoyl-(Acyl carrier protein) reductase
MRRQVTDPAAIETEIARIRSLRRDALRRHWRAVFGRTPPAGLSKDLLGRMIARRMQEQAFGGLDRDSLTFLDGLARHDRPARRQLKPGTVLVRDYRGKRHTVTVAREGFDWQGTTYPSLSAIARAITGTAWSGPRFFAVRAAGNGAKRRSATRPQHARHHNRPAINRKAEKSGKTIDQVRQESAAEYALRRFSTAQDVANVVAFLCSEKARQITGQDIAVDGGWATL